MKETNEPAVEIATGATSPETELKHKRNRTVLFVCCAFLLLITAIGGLLLAQHLREEEEARLLIVQSPTIHEGIYINSIHVGGMQRAQALQAVQASCQEYLNGIAFDVSAGERIFTLRAGALGITHNAAEVVDAAFQFGRSGSLQDLQAELADIAANHRQLTTSYAADASKVQAFTSRFALACNRDAEDAGFITLLEQENATEEEKKSEAYVTKMSSRMPEDSYAYRDHVDGIEIKQDELSAILLDMVASGAYQNFEAPHMLTEAAIKAEDLAKTMTLRGQAYTSFGKSPYNRKTRVFNIKKAVGLINGTVLQPGEVFSTNTTLGNRTYGGGWKAAPAIVRGRTEDQAGGGVCQVSTTLYNCVLKSDLEIVYRQGHSGKLSYVEGGLDATIDSGRIDFQFKNNTAAPIYLFGYVDEDKMTVTFEIHGAPFPDEYDEIQLSSKRVSGLSPSGSMKYTVDPSKPAGYSKVFVQRKSGSIWESYATYFKNGVEVKQVTIDRTRYNAYAGETIVGPSTTIAAAAAY